MNTFPHAIEINSAAPAQVTITPKQATERLRALGVKISPETVRQGIEQGKFPFGVSITTDKGAPVYLISAKKFDKFVEEWF